MICADADGDGRRGLVGVDLVWQGAATSTTHRLSRTVVEPDGTTASHGHHDVRTVRLEGHEDARYRGIDCGPMSLTAEMLDQ